MALCIGNATRGRAGLAVEVAVPAEPAKGWLGHRLWVGCKRLVMWMIRGYQHANAGDLAAAIAFNAMVALIPTFLLSLAVAGLFLRIDQVLTTATYATFWGLPPGAASDALNAALTAK